VPGIIGNAWAMASRSWIAKKRSMPELIWKYMS